MDDLGMSYVYSDVASDKDGFIQYQDDSVLSKMGRQFLSDLLSSSSPFTVKLSRTDEPSGFGLRTVTFRLRVRPVQSMNVREVKMEDLPTRTIALNYKQELIRRFKRFLYRSIHGY